MKKVLFLTNNLAGGGAERVLVNLVNNMDKNTYEVTLRVLINKGDNKYNLEPSIKYEYIFKRNFRGINYLHLLPSRYIYNKVAHGDFDVIIVYLHGVLTKIVSKAPKTQKAIAYLHADMTKSPFMKSFRNNKQIHKCFDSYDAIVSVSKSVQESFRKVTGISRKLYIKYNTFAVKEILNASNEPISSDIFEANSIKLCSVGKLDSVKGYDRLLRILKRLKDNQINFKLVIVGEGSERAGLERYINANNLEEQIVLVGYDKNPYKYISKCDLFVCSSYSEGFSSVVAECIILGVPVITTRCAGMSEILGDNNEYGVIVENDERSLYCGLKEIISNKEKLRYFAQKAKERSSFFNTQRSVREVEMLIDKVIDENS